MRAKLMRLKVDGKRVAFKRGNPPSTDLSHIETWTCPHCLKPTRKAKCIASHIQFGFDWDQHIDYFKCKCGTYYYALYDVFLWRGQNET